MSSSHASAIQPICPFAAHDRPEPTPPLPQLTRRLIPHHHPRIHNGFEGGADCGGGGGGRGGSGGQGERCGWWRRSTARASFTLLRLGRLASAIGRSGATVLKSSIMQEVQPATIQDGACVAGPRVFSASPDSTPAKAGVLSRRQFVVGGGQGVGYPFPDRIFFFLTSIVKEEGQRGGQRRRLKWRSKVNRDSQRSQHYARATIRSVDALLLLARVNAGSAFVGAAAPAFVGAVCCTGVADCGVGAQQTAESCPPLSFGEVVGGPTPRYRQIAVDGHMHQFRCRGTRPPRFPENGI